MQVLPIQFAFPDSKVLGTNSQNKDMFFSDLSPLGRAKKYKFFVEKEYYSHYSRAHFAVTMKKGGWDCLRHYEILASGALPYFIDIKKCPKKSLFNWPKDLLEQVKKLPGMPSAWKVSRATKNNKLDRLKPGKEFSMTQYWDLHKKFTEYFQKHLTCNGLSNYFCKSIDAKENAKILLCFGVAGSHVDYMRDVLISAIGSRKSGSLTIYPDPFWQKKSCHRVILNAMYGRGFTCTATLEDKSYASPAEWTQIENELNSFDHILACTSSNAGFEALPVEVQKSLEKRSDVIWVDGNDIKGNHIAPNCAKMVFRREEV